MAQVTKVDIRMYTTGTGDFFVHKYHLDDSSHFTMMVDAGTWQGSGDVLKPYVEDMKSFVDNKVDVLLVTHEHTDHVLIFDRCKNLFKNDFEVDEIWLAWSEEDGNELVESWKQDYGQKKMALVAAKNRINGFITDDAFRAGFEEDKFGADVLMGVENVSDSLQDFIDLHLSMDDDGTYKGGLKGMEIVKNDISRNITRYFKPGDIAEHNRLPGVKFYILGPPRSHEAIEKEHGKAGKDTYKHNKHLKQSDSFAAAVSTDDSEFGASPFDDFGTSGSLSDIYNDEKDAWRKIDHDWLISGAGNLALRLNHGINNLSLAYAAEFENKKVMLFPGDAEFGSWESWHEIDWRTDCQSTGDKHFTEDLLNRTVFYKVAHHLSHNGTAKEKGLEMMNSPELVSMATLNFDVISKGWKSTMPNRAILKELLERTRGRLIVQSLEGIYYDFNEEVPLEEKIASAKSQLTPNERESFEDNYEETDLYKQYTLVVDSEA